MAKANLLQAGWQATFISKRRPLSNTITQLTMVLLTLAATNAYKEL